MDVERTLRNSPWRPKPFGRRLLGTKPPSVSIADPAAEDRDVLRRQALAPLAGAHS
jgi:hypothetical protein